MKNVRLPGSRALRFGLVLVLTVLLSACQPDYGPPKITDIALDSDGIAVPIGSEYADIYVDTAEEEQSESRSLTEQGATTERCIANNECIRLVDEHTIEETTDGWETSEVVWQISPTDSWLNHEYGGAFTPQVGLFDIVEAQDGTVVVAGGQLGVITRSADGVWSPSVAEVRTLPLGVAGWLLTQALMVALAAWIGFGRANHGSRPAKTALALLTPTFLLSALTLYGTEGIGTMIFLLLSLPLLGAGISSLIGAGIRMWRSPNVASSTPIVFAGLLALLVAGWSGLYVLWSRGFASWSNAVPMTLVVLIGVSIAGSAATQMLPAKPWTNDDVFVVEDPLTPGQVFGRSLIYLTLAFVFVVFGVAVPGGLLLFLVLIPFGAIGWMVAKLPYYASDLGDPVDNPPERVLVDTPL